MQLNFSAQFPDIKSALIETIGLFDAIAENPRFAALLDGVVWPSCGDQIGAFQIGKQIGAGAFARVHLALDHSIGERQVVLKLCAFESDETDILGRLNHPNIISPLSLHDLSEWSLTGIVMPFLGTATLAHLISFVNGQSQNSSKVRIEEFLSKHAGYKQPEIMGLSGNVSIATLGRRIAMDVADALAFAHEQGFIHSDVKPENILLANDQTAKLLDFNLALSANGSVRPIGGTYRYMPPEHRHALLEQSTIDPSVDVYSLAVSLLALFGNPRQDSDTGPVPTTTPIQPDTRRLIGRRFGRLLKDCTLPNPEDRPSASIMAHRIRTLDRGVFPLQLCMALLIIFPLLFGTGLIRTDDQRLLDGWTALTMDSDPVSAIKDFTTLLSRDSATDDLRLLRACAGIEANDYATAMADLRTVESNPEISALLGYVVGSWSGSYVVAEKYFEQAYIAGIHRVDLLNNLAVCKERLAKNQESKELLQEAIQIRPNDLTILVNMVRVEYRQFDLNNEYNIDVELVDRMMDNPTAASHAECVYLAARCYLAESLKDSGYQSIGLQHASRAFDLGIPSRRISELTNLCPDASGDIERLVRNEERRNDNGESLQIDRFLKPPTSSAEYLRLLVGFLPGDSTLSMLTTTN